jgi:hypothetical protein
MSENLEDDIASSSREDRFSAAVIEMSLSLSDVEIEDEECVNMKENRNRTLDCRDDVKKSKDNNFCRLR